MNAVGKPKSTRVSIEVDGRVVEVNVGVCGMGGEARKGSAVGCKPRG